MRRQIDLNMHGPPQRDPHCRAIRFGRLLIMHWGGVGNDFDVEFASARTIEFREEYGLPAPEDEPPIFDPDGFGGADKHSFDVRIGVAFGMLVIAVVRDQTVERRFDVADNGGIIAFVDEHAGSCVRDIQMAKAVSASGFSEERFDLRGDAF